MTTLSLEPNKVLYLTMLSNSRLSAGGSTMWNSDAHLGSGYYMATYIPKVPKGSNPAEPDCCMQKAGRFIWGDLIRNSPYDFSNSALTFLGAHQPWPGLTTTVSGQLIVPTIPHNISFLGSSIQFNYKPEVGYIYGTYDDACKTSITPSRPLVGSTSFEIRDIDKKIWINSDSPSETYICSVKDISGRTVYNQTITGNNIVLWDYATTNLAAGVYIVNVIGGQTSQSYKVFVSK
jgi:hypothetical protein